MTKVEDDENEVANGKKEQYGRCHRIKKDAPQKTEQFLWSDSSMVRAGAL